jgi:hypothetical protein
MLYDGDELYWHGVGKYKATSGMTDHQSANQQTVRDAGPIPEGMFSLVLKIAGTAQVVDLVRGRLDTRQGIQSLIDMPAPDGLRYRSPEWGENRVRLTILRIDDPKARHRGGFYLHDSTKGFTHGCIEVEPGFFTRLRIMAATEAAKKHGRKTLIMKVKYPSRTESTYGGTAAP